MLKCLKGGVQLNATDFYFACAAAGINTCASNSETGIHEAIASRLWTDLIKCDVFVAQMINPQYPPKARTFLPGVFRFSMAGFLGSLLVMLIAEPLIVTLKDASIVEAAMLTLVLVAAVQAVGHSHRVLIWAAVLSCPAVIGRWCFEISQQRLMPEIHLVTGLLFILFIIVQLLRHILRAPRVDSEVLCAGIATYLMLGLLWSFVFKLVDWRTNGAFALNGVPDVNHALNNGFTSLYFSLMTLTTVGYGDITPVSDVARMLASLEALTGTMFVAVLISRLVAVYSKTSPEIQR